MKQEKINIGDFNEQVTWRQPVSDKDTFGQTQRTFSLYKTDFVSVDPVTIDENEVSNRLQYMQTYNFTGHYDANINNNYQLKYNNENYEIVRIEYLNLKRFMRVTATIITN